jgi:hypothetical protein
MVKMPAIIGKSVSRQPSTGFISRIARHPNASGAILDAGVQCVDVGIEAVRNWDRRATIREERDAHCAITGANTRCIGEIRQVMAALGDRATESHVDGLVDAIVGLANPRAPMP